MAPSFLAFFSKRENARTLRKPSDSPSQSRTTTPAGLPPTSSINTSTSPSIGPTSEQLEGSQLSLETEYVIADADSPTKLSSVYPLGSASSNAGASTTKIRIPFRKKTSSSTEILASVQSIAPPRSKEPHKSSIESSLSDPSLRPPPSRSAVFGSYADPHNAMSTRSLPQDMPLALSHQSSRNTSRNYYETMSNPDSHVTSPVAPPSEQPSKGGIFSWARPRARTKSKVSVPDSSIRLSPAPLPADSFNLKSFRHVTPSASRSPNPDPAPSSSPPNRSAASRSRTRENSDSSQRISVAAFREVQARRSTAGSPVPSLPGDRDGFVSGEVRIRRRSSPLGTPPPLSTSGPQTPLFASRSPQTRSPITSLYIPNSLTSESSDEGESESEKEATLRPNRQRTVTNRSLGATQSELGHRSSPVFSAARSDSGHGTPLSSPGLVSPSPRSMSYSPNVDAPGRTSRDSSVYSRTRASVSTSALVPDVAKPASMIPKYSTAPRPIQSSRTISRDSTPSESSSSSSSSEDAPLSSRISQRPESAVSRASESPVRRPLRPLIDIGELVAGNMTLSTRTSEPLKDSPDKADSPTVRPRKTSFGIGERLSALASGFGSSQPSLTKSPGSASDSRDEAFIPPEVPKMPRPPSPIPSPLSPPVSPIKPASRALGRRVGKPALRKSSEGPKVDTSSLNFDSGITPPPSSSTSSDAPIPFIKPRPIRERQEPPAFAVTSRPISHASNPSSATLAALDKAIADANETQGLSRSVVSIPDQVKEDQRQQQRRQTPPESQTTVRVVRGVPSKPSREDPLPVVRPHSRPRVLSTGVIVSNIRVTSPPVPTSPPASALRHRPGNGPAARPRKPFALRDSSPASSAGDSNSSRMPPTPRDGSELGTTSTGRPGIGHRKRASVTFADSVEGDQDRVRRRSISVGSRPSHGHGHTVAADSSDDEATVQDREREAEEKRKERRRKEAKAAIELGNVINGPGPIDDDDDDDEEEQPLNVPPRMAMGMNMSMDMNPNHNIPFPTSVGPMGFQGQWGASAAAPLGVNNLTMRNLLNSGPGANFTGGMDMGTGMNMNMGMGMVDPRVFAAHQQAMQFAKQTYQLAVAQQAMRNAADEWERGSAISGWGGASSSVGTSSVLGMGMNMGMNMNMNMGGMGTGGFPGAASSLGMANAGGMGWPAGGMAGFPGGPGRPMFGGGMYAASEIGGGSDRGGSAGWTTNSVYGESFGAPRDRSSRGVRQNQVPQMPSSGGGSASAQAAAAKREGGRPRTRTAPSSGAGQRVGNAVVKKRGEGFGLVGAVSPPSSWKGPS